MILVAYRHGLRASELTDLRRDQVEFTSATLHVRRAKQGTPSTHPIRGDELRACGGSTVSKSPSRHSCSRPNVVRRSPRQALRGWWNGRAPWRALASRPIPVCCGTPAATPWPTRGTIRGRCKPIWVAGTFSTRALHRDDPKAVQGFLARLATFRRKIGGLALLQRISWSAENCKIGRIWIDVGAAI